MEGYRIYNESFVPAANPPVYTRVIELVRQKIVISCRVRKDNDPNIRFTVSNVKVRCPDGRIIVFHSPGSDDIAQGLVKSIHDATMKNSITFTYTEDAKIDYITDTVGRTLDFDYHEGAYYNYITVSLQAEDTIYSLVKYKTNRVSLKK